MLLLQRWRRGQSVYSSSQLSSCRWASLIAIIVVVMASSMASVESQLLDEGQNGIEANASIKSSTVGVVQATTLPTTPAPPPSPPAKTADKKVDKRVGSAGYHHDEYHQGQFVSSHQQSQRFRNDDGVLRSNNGAFYQRTMIRNPEDAFTANIQTNFQCPRGRPGYYADVQNGCRVFHICHEYLMPNGEPHSVRYAQFCPPGTIFDQLTLTCNFEWAAVPCGSANQFFYINSNLYQPDVHFISDADVERGRSLNPSRYRAYEPERYTTYAQPAPVTTRTATRTITKNIISQPAPVVYRSSSSRPTSSPAVTYETTRYISHPAVTYRTSGGRVHYDTHIVTQDGGHSDVHSERNLVEPLTTRYARPASVGERLVAETPRRANNVIITPPSHTHAHVHTHRPETPSVSVHPAQVRFSSYSPHMSFLGFIPDQHYTTVSSDSFPYNRATSGTFRSYDSQYQNVIPNVPVLSPKNLPRLESPLPERIQPPRFTSEHHRSYEHSHRPNVPAQRPLIPASEFPGFQQSTRGGSRSSLTIQHSDPHAHQHHHHHHESNRHHARVAPTLPTAAPQQRSLPPVPVVPVTTEKRPASHRTEEIVEEVIIDKARRPVAVTLQQYDSRHAHDFGRRAKSRSETTDFVQEPITVRGGRRSKTLFPTTVDEVPYLKRTARSHREFVEPAFKGASAIPGIIPQEYLE